MTAASPKRRDYRDITIFPPYPDEMPTDLLGDGDPDDLVRVAKLDGLVIGAYRLAQLTETQFAIKALTVREAYRGRGVGRWMLGHAIGIAELKGARAINAPLAAAAFFAKVGFERQGSRLRLNLTPE